MTEEKFIEYIIEKIKQKDLSTTKTIIRYTKLDKENIE